MKRLSELAGEDLRAVVITGETTAAVLADIESSGLPRLAKPLAPFKLRAVLLDLLAR